MRRAEVAGVEQDVGVIGIQHSQPPEELPGDSGHPGRVEKAGFDVKQYLHCVTTRQLLSEKSL